MLPTLLETHFQQRIPLPDDTDSGDFNAAISEATCRHQIMVGTLVRAMFVIRTERYWKDAHASLNASRADPRLRYMIFARTFYQQVAGFPSIAQILNKNDSANADLASVYGSLVLWDYSMRISEALRSL